MLDPNAFRKPDSLAAAEEAKLEVRTPKKDEEITLHPEWAWSDMMTVKRNNGHQCLIHPAVVNHISMRRLTICTLRAAASSNGGCFVWAVPNDKYKAAEAAQTAIGNWRQIKWDSDKRTYVSSDSTADHGQPSWPFATFNEMVETAFGDHIVDSVDHKFFKEVAGE